MQHLVARQPPTPQLSMQALAARCGCGGMRAAQPTSSHVERARMVYDARRRHDDTSRARSATSLAANAGQRVDANQTAYVMRFIMETLLGQTK